jgi:hypothetical protein
MLTFLLFEIGLASSVSWCDDFDYCSRDYQCRALINVTSYGTMKIVPDFDVLTGQCNLTGDVDENSLRVVSQINGTTYAPHYYDNVLLFSANNGPGPYYLYFSNETKPKSIHKLEYEWEEIQDCSKSAWTTTSKPSYLIFSTSGNNGFCDLNFNAWYSASMSQSYQPNFLPMRFSYDVPTYGTADGGCNLYGGGGVYLYDGVSASPGGSVRNYISNTRRCSGIGSYQVDDIIETTNATYIKGWGVGGAGNGQFYVKNYKAYIAKYDAEPVIMGVETAVKFDESKILSSEIPKKISIELKNMGDEDAKNITLESTIGILNETEIAIIEGQSSRFVSLDLSDYEPGVYNIELTLNFDGNGVEKIEKQILLYDEIMHQAEAWLSLTNFGEHSSFILNKTLYFVNNGTTQFNLSEYADAFCFGENESKILNISENRTLRCYFEFSEKLFVSEELSNESIILTLINPYPYKINTLHWEYLRSSEKEIENTTDTINGIDANSEILVRVPFINTESQSQQDQGNESYQGVQQSTEPVYPQIYEWYPQPLYQQSLDDASSSLSSDAVPPSINETLLENNTLSENPEVEFQEDVLTDVSTNDGSNKVVITKSAAVGFNSGLLLLVVAAIALATSTVFVLHRYRHNSFRKFRRAVTKKMKANRVNEATSKKAHRAEEQKRKA